jgi:phosphatidylinositol glycan class N
MTIHVGDGLRADKAFQFFPDPSPSALNDSASQELRPLAPFLRSRILEHGTFGVSHTRVPTESRPGHVALIAGLYEDVAAVTTGWKLNPVNFDSVFNRSRHTWSWGSPDILPMFSTGAVPGRVEDSTYGYEFEDYSKDATELDTWVFDRVKNLFSDAETDRDLNNRLREDKNVFFLHLLGLDTTGHSYRPYSREYLHNIQIVDQGVREVTELVESFFGDDKTAFVFTADHGMSDWGSHGDGHPDNTRTPLIVWGSGVAKPVTVAEGFAPGHEDGFSHDWQLDHVQRHDVAQADVAALMAHLAGLEFPVNSVGELPLSFLDADDEQKSKALLTNAKEILEMYRVKEEQKQQTVLRYQPFSGFATGELTIENRIAAIEQLIEQGAYTEAMESTDALIKLGLRGLRYLQTYAWLFLRTLVTAGYLGWIAFAFTTAVDVYMLNGEIEASRSTPGVIFFSSVLVALYSYLFMQSSPVTYYAYAIFPVAFWEEVFTRRKALSAGVDKIFAKLSQGEIVKLVLNIAVYVALLEVMVSSLRNRSVSEAGTNVQSGPKLLPPPNLHHLLCSHSSLAFALRNPILS